MNHDNERKAFDAYFKDKYPELHKDVFNEDGDDRAIIGYSFALSAWLASANREGYKLVPVEPNFETMQEMNVAIIENSGETPKYRMQQVYKAMIGACGDH